MFEDRQELGIVERPAVNIGKDLNSACAESNGAVDLL
jgi:hypothetical protein